MNVVKDTRLLYLQSRHDEIRISWISRIFTFHRMLVIGNILNFITLVGADCRNLSGRKALDDCRS